MVLCCMFICSTGLQAQELTPKLIGNWQFKQVLDAAGKPLDGTVNPLELDLRKDGTFLMLTKSKKLKGNWTEKDSSLYLQTLPATDSMNHTQVMRILKIEADTLQIYAGAEKGNEVRFIYTRRKKK
ncbi:hypothetical protein SAMN04487930_11317 [Cytophaga hutchinsonii ATCC 33406]|nr:hypothetical protein SAMN04487930_11317 [Cytophaga hutchinsonii ATCC 33406]